MTGLYDGPVVDAHHHLWTYRAHQQPWLAADRLVHLRRSFEPADYHAAASGLNVVATVWIEAPSADPLHDALLAERWAAQDGGTCNAIVAHAPLDAPDIEARLDALQAHLPRLRGIRDIVAVRPGAPSFARRPDLLASSAFERGLHALASRGLVFDLMVEAPQLAEAARLIARLPALQVVVEHAGGPDLSTAEGEAAWRAGLRDLSVLSNVAIKISALHCRQPGWTDARLAGPIRAVIAEFGPHRVAFASDYPVHDATCPMGRAYATFARAVDDLSRAEQAMLFAGTAARLYRLDGPGLPGVDP